MDPDQTSEGLKPDQGEPNSKVSIIFGTLSLLTSGLPLMVSGGLACSCCFGIPLGLVGLWFGIVGLRKKERSASTGITLCVLGLSLDFIVYMLRASVPYRPPFP